MYTIIGRDGEIVQRINNAVQDAYNFVKLLKENKQKPIRNIIDMYNEEMIGRTKKYVELSRGNVMFLHSPDALDKTKLYEFKNWKK